jgi:hypothetical protein
MKTKKCCKCGQIKDVNEFYNDKRNSDKLYSWCKQCFKNNCLEIKKEVIAYYGGKCVCCGETELDFLALDHINNDGAEHKKKLKSEGKTYTGFILAKQMGYPKTFQLLCFNCNWSKRIHGKCIHQIIREKVVS